MSGFLDNIGLGKVGSNFEKLSNLGRNYDDLLIRNSQAIGYIEGELRKRSGMGTISDDMMKYSIALTDTTSSLRTKTLAFFQLDYATKRDRLRDIASNSEIEFVLDTIADDAIVFDKHNRFCHPSDISDRLSIHKGISPTIAVMEYTDKIRERYVQAFDDIYCAWGFDNGIAPWQYFVQWLIEGHLAFEIIYDDLNKPKKIIGFKELDPATLYPIVNTDNNGKLVLKWLQRDDSLGKHRELTDAQVIYISYSNHFKTKRVSFVERMVRSFNLLRIMEQSKVIWHIVYAPIRLKTSVPIGTKSIQKAKEDVREFLNVFKEDINLNSDTGELHVDGQPKLMYYKNYITPVNDRGEKIDIETLEHTGPDLQDSQLLNYFFKKLKLDSKLPFSRWDYNEGGGSYLLGPDTVTREEIAYGKFIGRLRTGFQELIVKPLYLQMCMDYDTLKKDFRFKSAVGVNFEDEKIFEKLKTAEIMKKGAETVKILAELKNTAEDQSLHMDFLMKRFMDFTEEDTINNKAAWDKDKLLKSAKEASAAAAPASQGQASTAPAAQGQAPAAQAPAAQAQVPAQEAPPQGQAPAQEAPPTGEIV